MLIGHRINQPAKFGFQRTPRIECNTVALDALDDDIEFNRVALDAQSASEVRLDVCNKIMYICIDFGCFISCVDLLFFGVLLSTVARCSHIPIVFVESERL